ncbi:MAG: cation:proton antiporter [Myxococcales bacterium]|nr:cation:proton antiporter [Myxococcales bacterium]
MEHERDLILTLSGALTAALLLGLVARRARLSPIVGYLSAGVAVGPFTPGFVAHGELAKQLAELGVVLLLFGVGLNLHPQELLRVRRVAVPGALAGMAAATCAGWLAAGLPGWTFTARVVFGLAVSVTSTVVLLRVFADRELLHTQAGQIAVGWLLVEDVLVVLAVILLPTLASGASGASSSGPLRFAGSVAFALFKIIGLVAITLLVGGRVVPRLLALASSTRSREMFTLTVLVIALGLAVTASALFGASMALGAFLAGLVVGQSDFGSRAASEALPMRDAFAVLFFVATGMLLDPGVIVANLPLTLATLGAVLVAKPLVALTVALLLRYPARTALGVALGLGQIGEFSFVVAALGGHLGLLPASAVQSLVATAMITITLNPLLLALVEPLARRLESPGSVRSGAAPRAEGHRDPAYRAVVVGYGPVGRSLVRLLVENGVAPTIIELNHETVAALHAEGLDAVYGDASQREILERAGVASAGSLFLTASDSPTATVRLAKEMRSNLLVLARATYLSEMAALRDAGATHVVTAEAEVALAMGERLLQALGATSDQLDRARERLRRLVVEA